MADTDTKNTLKDNQFIQDLKKSIADNTLHLQEALTKTQISSDLSKLISDYQKNILPNNAEHLSVDSIQEWIQNLTQMMVLGQKLSVDIFLNASQKYDVTTADPLGISETWLDIWASFAKKPETIIDYNLNLWHDYMSLCTQTFKRLSGEQAPPVIPTPKNDRRFKADVWNDATFDFIRQCYLMMSDSMVHAIDKACYDLRPKEKERTLFFVKQFIDAMSPSNFLMTNPEALQETFKTGGKNLVKGLENLVRDFERGKGRLMISQTDFNAFKVGVDLAATKGKVVFRNELVELIHYTPTTPQTYAIPLLILPPFINKFYILDLKPENSMIKWLVSKGFSVFVASWKNPTAKYAHYSFKEYIDKGLIACITAILKMTGQKKVSAVGYCIAGTMLTMALARMKKQGQDLIANATYFASQSDFSDAGELSLFINEKQINNYIQIMQKAGGILEGTQMADTFNMLRSNDLVWSFVVNNYLMGKSPFPFDLLYWNSDTTNIPMQLQIDYLKSCYLNNDLANNRFKIDNILIEPSLINIPMYIQSSKEDHIAPVASVFRGAKLYNGLVRFITAGSGHIAGVINHPDKQKYQYWTNDKKPVDFAGSFDEWFSGATEHTGSWWLDWHEWLIKQSGKQIEAFVPAMEYVLDNAPGQYVRE